MQLTEVAPLVIKYVEMEQSYQTVGNIFKAEFLGNNKMKKIAEAQQDADQNKALNSTSDSSAPRSKKRRLSDDSDDEEATKQVSERSLFLVFTLTCADGVFWTTPEPLPLSKRCASLN